MDNSTTQPSNAPAAVPRSRTRTILHLSDLHFGWQFNGSNWADVKIEARKVAPDLVMVTGDLVNTPWFWMWWRAKSELTTFIRDLRQQTGKTDLPLRVIPGNHDTRISGIYPVPWLLPSALACAALAAVCYWLYGTATGTPWLALLLQVVGWTSATLMAAAIGLRGLVRRDIRRALGEEFWLADAELFPKLALGIVGFDSASTRLSWARGHVTPASIVQGKNAMLREEEKLAGDRRPLWMAAVHHHPLPLPYDSVSEHMMVMDNAGSFLRELARRNIKLILHGHKHHQHFARIAVDPATAQRLEIAVLSAGTPTHGSSSGVFRHGFNVIRVFADDRLEVEMFEAEPEGGTFCSTRSFDVVPSEDHARDQFEERKQRYALWCRRMVCIADINEYGDARFVREFRGVKSTRARVKDFPSSLPASAYSGLIEGYRVQSLSDHGPGVTFRIEKQQRNEMVARVWFKGDAGLQEEDDPIDFMTEFQGNNAFALNRWQFESMYPRDDYLEYVSFRAPEGVAVEELVLHVRFPDTTGLPGRLDIRAGQDTATGQEWTPFQPRTLVQLESQNAVETRIMHPVPNTIYQINWDLEEVTPRVEDAAVEHAIGRALALRAWLAGLHTNKTEPPSDLIEVLKAAEHWVREKLVQEPPSDDRPLNAVLFCYVESEKKLSTVASNYDADDPRSNWTFPFGLGVPGRAFKSAEITAFTRPYDWKSGRPPGYMFGAGPATDEARLVPEVALLAFPLAAPEAPDWPYAVLQMGTDQLDVRLHTADTPTDKILEEVNAAVQENLIVAFESIMQELRRAAGKVKP